jgi:peptide/nickel transport system permease protein
VAPDEGQMIRRYIRTLPWTIRVFVRDASSVGGLIVLATLLGCALWPAGHLPQDPLFSDLSRRFLPPAWVHGGSATFPLGTDQLGRDLLSRMMYAARFSLSIASGAVALGATLGTLLGIVGGYFGGGIDALVMRAVDVQLAFPLVLLVIAVIAVLGTNPLILVLVFGIPSWAQYARIVRAATLSLRERQHIEAAHAIGCDTWRIIARHLLPNLTTPLVILTTFELARLLLLESAVSFLGFGIQPPTPSWGTMIADGRDQIYRAWWVSTMPGLAIVLAVLSFNLVGDGLRDVFDPKGAAKVS